MIRILATVFAGLLGLAFGSFLNVFLTRWPQGESIITPRSHCRNCDHTLAWLENIPILSWLMLRGRCRNCHTWIGVRYPLVELAIGGLWALAVWRTMSPGYNMQVPSTDPATAILDAVRQMIFYWLLVALAVLDAEHLWLPNLLTVPGIVLGFLMTNFQAYVDERATKIGIGAFGGALVSIFGILAAAGLVLLIRWLYWLVRKQEGIGLGDVKLMAMLAAWLGLPLTLVAFVIAAFLGALAGLVVIAIPAARTNRENWATSKLPFGTFLCLGGIVSSLCGERILAAYLHFAGF